MSGEASGHTRPLHWAGVSKRYKVHFWQRPVTSLDGLELAVRPGEVLGLVGHNGAGKTTAIKLALGLIFPDRGRVELFGRSPEDPGARRAVGFLPESPYFPDDLTGRELVELSARLAGLDARSRRRSTREILDRVGLAEAADRPLRRYSKGMVQRAGLARALVHAPRLVILDEPMSGLDPIGRREVRDLVLELRAAGTTVVLSSHVLADVEMLCDRVAILHRGRLVTTAELSRLAADRRVKFWEVEVRGGGRIEGARLVSARGQTRLLRFPATMGSGEILERIMAARAELLALTPHRESLEDLFLRAQGHAREGEDGPRANAMREERPVEVP